MKIQRKIELLAPAKNKEIGIQAILHGADAVYIGVQGFSARASAGNSVEDIAELVNFAHQYFAKVYVAVNVILWDEELPKVEKLIWELYKINADAVIIQDLGVLQLNIPPIPLHASTQMDNRTPAKAKFLEEAGLSQIVLARELTIDQIKNICQEVSVPIEIFIHGALCVSYSGQCYMSQAVTERSANRGACAQMCRLPYDLLDADGKEIRKNSHLLSLRDFNQFDNLEALLDAGVSSLKIEGRLKDETYVKNVVASYRRKLDEIFEKRPEFRRASSGSVNVNFKPDLSKSFNRGFTDYFSNGRQQDIWSFDSPKSIGEYIGKTARIFSDRIMLKTDKTINNGDGFCFIGKKGLKGFRINRADGKTIFPTKMPEILPETNVYRNYDNEFEARLSKPTAERKIDASIKIWETIQGFALQITDEDDCSCTIMMDAEKSPAQKPQIDNIKNQLSKTGNTPFNIREIETDFSEEWFIPSSLLTEARRNLTEKLLVTRKITYPQQLVKIKPTNHPFLLSKLTYLGNVSNDKSRQFYAQHGTKVKESALEIQPRKDATVMFTKYCIKYALGFCPKESKEKHPFREPFYLVNQGNKFELKFDCKNCEMQVLM